MKSIIEFGVSILLMALVAKNLPSILRKVHQGQFIILKEASASQWGKAWVPKTVQ